MRETIAAKPQEHALKACIFPMSPKRQTLVAEQHEPVPRRDVLPSMTGGAMTLKHGIDSTVLANHRGMRISFADADTDSQGEIIIN